MKTKIFKTNVIHSVDDWYKYSPPQNPKLHWKNGRSAQLLAEYVTSREFTQDIGVIIKECGFHVPSVLYCEPEATTKLPCRGTGRKHDLLIEGKDFIIGIEAKVSEYFGSFISNEYEKQSEGKRCRVDKLLSYIGLNIETAKDYRYQLLTGYVGTLLEAKKRNKNKCLFLVMMFLYDKHLSEKDQTAIENNNKDYHLFCRNLLKLSSDEGAKTYIVDGKQIICYIKKVKIIITDSKFIIN